MRVLSISHRLPGMSFDNHSLFNAPSLFDYDALVLGAGAVMDSIRAAARAEGEFAALACGLRLGKGQGRHPSSQPQDQRRLGGEAHHAVVDAVDDR